jgi:hypothetical protein
MNSTDRKAFSDGITMLCEMFGKESSTALLDAYWIALRGWSLEDFTAAISVLLSTSKFMPRPADFNEVKRKQKLTAGEAWARVLEHIRSGRAIPLGQSASVSTRQGMGDPIIDAVVQMVGGYYTIGHASQNDLPHLERHFLEHYENQETVEESREALAGPGNVRRLERK